MKLAIISHKECWRKDQGGGNFVTSGGFPRQIAAISELFDETHLLVPVREGACPPGLEEIIGHDLSVEPLEALPRTYRHRVLYYPFWLLRNGRRLWRVIGECDAVYAIIPGDVGTFGFLCALVRRKLLFVRHCGEWNRRTAVKQFFWVALMELCANRQRIMFATGGGAEPPSRRNPAISWIFASVITDEELERLVTRRQADFGAAPRLVIACRQVRHKGTVIVIESLALVQKTFSNATLDVIGDGPALGAAKQRARELQIEGSVRFHGQVPRADVMRLVSDCHLLCYPVRTEGFPKIVVEAMACGLPVVATAVSVLPELVGGDAGIVISERTPQALAQGIRACLDDQECYGRMSGQAVATARRYSLKRWQSQIRTTLESAWGPLRDDA